MEIAAEDDRSRRHGKSGSQRQQARGYAARMRIKGFKLQGGTTPHPVPDRELRRQIECEQIAPQAGGPGRAYLSLEFLLCGHPVSHRGFEFIAARGSEREAHLPGIPIAVAAFGHYKTIALK